MVKQGKVHKFLISVQGRGKSSASYYVYITTGKTSHGIWSGFFNPILHSSHQSNTLI
jgi:hypothetical protein